MRRCIFVHDLDDDSDARARRLARRLSREPGALLILVHVDEHRARERTDPGVVRVRLRALADGLDVPTRIVTARGSIASTARNIAEQADCDALVMGTDVYESVDGALHWIGSFDAAAGEIERTE